MLYCTIPNITIHTLQHKSCPHCHQPYSFMIEHMAIFPKAIKWAVYTFVIHLNNPQEQITCP